jgi:hypothetical protein
MLVGSFSKPTKLTGQAQPIVFGLGPMTLGMMLYVVGSALIPAALSAVIDIAEAPLGALWA